MEVEWSNRAKKGLKAVVEYLEINWGKEQIQELDNDVVRTISQIKTHSKIGIQTSRRTNVRKCYPNKHTYLSSRLHTSKQIIYIVNFRATKQKTTISKSVEM